MLDKLQNILAEAEKTAGLITDAQELEKLKLAILGRKGTLTEILRGLSVLPIEERKKAGERANAVREQLESLIDSRLSELKRKALAEKLLKEKIDITLPGLPLPNGHFHPIRQTLDEMTGIFESLGFKTAEGPEIETDWYNFEALNIPRDHPARDSQDTFYLQDDDRLLRTHTSPVQARVMEKTQPPVRIIAPGRVFRNEATDATHSAIFHQVEGLYVDKNVTFADLKGTLTLFVHRYFSP